MFHRSLPGSVVALSNHDQVHDRKHSLLCFNGDNNVFRRINGAVTITPRDPVMSVGRWTWIVLSKLWEKRTTYLVQGKTPQNTEHKMRKFSTRTEHHHPTTPSFATHKGPFAPKSFPNTFYPKTITKVCIFILFRSYSDRGVLKDQSILMVATYVCCWNIKTGKVELWGCGGVIEMRMHWTLNIEHLT